jgi:hypothetical protein
MTEDRGWRPNKGLFASLLRMDKAGFSRCLEPSLRCSDRAIRAHSVQNARSLDRLVRNGHVVTFRRSVTLDDGPKIELASIGRNQATTFTGLCARHDDLLFAPIEKNELKIVEEEHRFLLAYRAAFRELHATMEGAIKLQGGYLERVRRGLDPSDSPSPAGMAAVQRMVVSWETYRYKSLLDLAYAKRDFSILSHDLIELDVARPTVAACALFSVDDVHVRDDILRIHLNVLPMESSKTVAMFSYLQSDASHARAFLDRILRSDGPYQKYEISRLILNSCENFVLCPDYVDTWPAEKKNAVTTYFIHTLMKNDLAYESPSLYLF